MKKLWWKLRYAHYMTGKLGGYSKDLTNFGFSWYNAGVGWDSATEQDRDEPGCPYDAVDEEMSCWG